MEYTSFRIKRATYQKLKKLRDKEKLTSIDSLINILLDKNINKETNENLRV